MSTFFALLLMLSLGFLAWGVISPKSLSNVGKNKRPISRKQSAVGFGLISVVLFTLVGITAPKKTSVTDVKSQSPVSGEQLTNTPKVEPEPVTTTVNETEDIAFETTTVNSASITKGTTQVTTIGVLGKKTKTYEVTTKDDKEVSRKLVKEEVTKQPVTEVTSVGTKAAPKATTPAPKTTAPSASSGARTGATCKDGSHSNATGSGACSHHGGVSVWLY